MRSASSLIFRYYAMFLYFHFAPYPAHFNRVQGMFPCKQALRFQLLLKVAVRRIVGSTIQCLLKIECATYGECKKSRALGGLDRPLKAHIAVSGEAFYGFSKPGLSVKVSPMDVSLFSDKHLATGNNLSAYISLFRCFLRNKT